MSSLFSLTLQAGVETGVNHLAASSPPSSPKTPPKSHGKGINVNEQVSGGMTSNPKASMHIHTQESSHDKKKADLNSGSGANEVAKRKKARQDHIGRVTNRDPSYYTSREPSYSRRRH
ncbi:uncharacterized protein FA14DRAFT_181177 [Meira miltonrushii]|uniref:Uncharacterized protein n=1 Tax=Meira miltonrushii TaxID=1280837 RepID=A0A316V4K5_9BASI|nr:uncharacterized protein FA14DRAFT_181177 [Meira miltonrushii]PWN32489.1 hypothetical protein FA14DRAFT_181177 [Meira miltonrushii]